MLPKERGAEEGRRRVHRTKSSTVSRWLMPVESCIDLGGAPQADNHLTPGKRPPEPSNDRRLWPRPLLGRCLPCLLLQDLKFDHTPHVRHKWLGEGAV
jgi:hypothetical protein